MQNYRETVQLLNRRQLFSLCKILSINNLIFRSTKSSAIREFGETLTPEDIENISPILSSRLEVEDTLTNLAHEANITVTKARTLFCVDRFTLKDSDEIEIILSRLKAQPKEISVEVKSHFITHNLQRKETQNSRRSMIEKEFKKLFKKNKNLTQKDISDFVKTMVEKTGNKTRTVQEDIQILGLRQYVNQA